jgi:hypothetical protein
VTVATVAFGWFSSRLVVCRSDPTFAGATTEGRVRLETIAAPLSESCQPNLAQSTIV